MQRLIDVQLSCSTWGLRRVLKACRGLSPEQFTQPLDTGPPPGSVQAALAHAVEAMFYFADNFSGRQYQQRPRFKAGAATPDGLLTLLDEADGELRGAIQGFLFANEGNLDAPLRWSHSRETISAAVALAQVFDHATHHRVQAVHMLKKLGVAPLPQAFPLAWSPQEQDGT
jgi:uncharacterized damage-inducible protein DinB